MVVVTTSKEVAKLSKVEAEDFFVVSSVFANNSGLDEVVASFKVGDDEFAIYKANKHKCPRCWKFNASKEDELCHRCSEVVA